MATDIGQLYEILEQTKYGRKAFYMGIWCLKVSQCLTPRHWDPLEFPTRQQPYVGLSIFHIR